MDQPEKPKKRGRKQQYPRLTSYQDGAPLLTTRIDPEKLEWVKSRPEGTRPYLERLIGEDKERVVRADREATANGEDTSKTSTDAG